MGIGVSTSCYYPLETELALQKVALLGAKTCEIFINTWSELERPFLDEICRIKDANGIRIPSLHPFLSFGEPYLLFSEYERRFTDTLDFFNKYFDAANILGAKILVMHGSKPLSAVSDELYFERFAKLMENGRKHGITVAQENVVHYRSESSAFLTAMKDYIGSTFKIVLDLKQAGRAGYSAFDFVAGLEAHIAHIHISDFDDMHDCLPPGEGKFDYVRLFSVMSAAGYTGDYIIEIYRHNFADESQLTDAMLLMEKLHCPEPDKNK